MIPPNTHHLEVPEMIEGSSCDVVGLEGPKMDGGSGRVQEGLGGSGRVWEGPGWMEGLGGSGGGAFFY